MSTTFLLKIFFDKFLAAFFGNWEREIVEADKTTGTHTHNLPLRLISIYAIASAAA